MCLLALVSPEALRREGPSSPTGACGQLGGMASGVRTYFGGEPLEGGRWGLAGLWSASYLLQLSRSVNAMRKQILIGALVLPCLAFAQATKTSSETKVESTTSTPDTNTKATSDKTVKTNADGSSSAVTEKSAKSAATGQPTKKSHTKKTVEKAPDGTVTKSETVKDSK
jgi:hypothetical protein